jgi:glycosyltransferase involved in cell wall biosynthesis
VTAQALALRTRLESVAPHIASSEISFDRFSTMELLLVLARAVRDDLDKPRFWLLLTAVGGSMPTHDEYLRALRVLELAHPGAEHYALLEGAVGIACVNDNFTRPFRVLDAAVVVDVDFTARHGHNTGVQRVVRETVSRWDALHDVEFIAWTQDAQIMRSLLPEEHRRVVAWNSTRKLESSPREAEDMAELLVPWRSVVVIPEVSQPEVWQRLACLAEFSGNRVAMIGHDAIPVTSAEFIVPTESERFVRYLSIVKHADVVMATCVSSSKEFSGFADALRVQGLPGPEVRVVNLPIALSAREEEPDAAERASDALPLVVCVGTQEPRKNQLAVLAASEILWREGLEFEVLFIGAAAMPLSIPFDVELARLAKLGRTVRVERLVTDAGLERAYRDARFSIFVSLHEGYGLPVAESLAAGTPVVTSNYGSMAEIAEDGGCILVDPRDDEAIADGMRRLLTDDPLRAELVSRISGRPRRSWDDYAADLWSNVASLEQSA